MKKLLFYTLILALISSYANAQTIDDDGQELITKCSTSEMYLKLLRDHPEQAESIHESEQQQATFRKEFEKTYHGKDDGSYLIPVVFHVVHNYGSEDISPAQIEDAIRVMNDDFSAQNSGVVTVNPAFASIVANTGIQFALARRDPDGNCTNGIIRIASPITSEGGQNLKELSPAWDRSMYLNIWVCETIESGAAGYSRYPSSVNNAFGATIDGIVVRSDYVGSIETSSLNKSHTLTHEVGHYLDLPHLWGSTNDPAMPENCDTDDGVSDTPNTIGWTACATNAESCGSLDNVENYMEYAYCSKMFTLGQSARMIAALNSLIAERWSLWQPENMVATGVNSEDQACSAEFVSDKRIVCAGETIHFSDFSYNGIETRVWTFPGGIPSASLEEQPAVVFNTPGRYSVELVASDGFNQVSTIKTDYIRVLDTAYTALPFSDSFENTAPFNSVDNDIWFTENLDGENDWELTDLAAYSGTTSAYVHGNTNAFGETENLYSQTFDLGQVEDHASLSFKYACAKRSINNTDRLRVWISKDCGNFWSLRKTLQGDQLYTVSQNVNTEFIPINQSQWREVLINNIGSVFLNSEFRVRFEFRSGNGNNFFIDDINIQDLATVSVDEIIDEMQNSLKIYPNPAVNSVKVEMKTPHEGTDLIVRLHDITGREIRQIFAGTISGQKMEFTIDVNDLSDGLYFLEFASPEGDFAGKFVIQK